MKRATTGKNANGSADDVPALSKRQLAKLRPVLAERNGKTRITIMLDDDVLAFFRDITARDGVGYQTLINDVLRNSMTEQEGAPEKKLRKIVRKDHRPTHPGAILREDVLPHLKLTQTTFARRLGVSRVSVSELLHEKRALSPDMAVRIGKFTNTTPESWLQMQLAVDLWDLEQEPARYKHIRPVAA